MKKDDQKLYKAFKVTLITHALVSLFFLVVVMLGLEIYFVITYAEHFTGGPLPIFSCPLPGNYWNECAGIFEFLIYHIFFGFRSFLNYRFHVIFIPAIVVLFGLQVLFEEDFSKYKTNLSVYVVLFVLNFFSYHYFV